MADYSAESSEFFEHVGARNWCPCKRWFTTDLSNIHYQCPLCRVEAKELAAFLKPIEDRHEGKARR